MPTCRRCGEENPYRSRFCGNCGASLAPAVPRGEVRRTVTVVFSDVVGSTSLAEHVEPESLRKAMARHFEQARSILERHGGTVEKFIGDAVMAVFGIPQAHEDDALRAIRAVTDLREAVDSLNPELSREWGLTIRTRTGVNTGEVVAGDPADGQAFVTGDAVNVAARLEQVAAAGEVLIGEDTFKLVRDAVTVEALEPLAVKNRDRPVAAYRLIGVAAWLPGRVRRLDVQMVGRVREKALLLQAFRRAMSDRACRLATVLGAAGVGKSRLVEGFVRSVEGAATVVRGRCVPYGEGITFWPIAEIVKQAAKLVDRDSAEVSRQRIEALLAGDRDAGLIAQRIAHLVGFAGAQAVPEDTFWAVRRLVEALARRRPLVVVLDDIQWAEPTLLDLVDDIAARSRGVPLFIVCVARPDLLEARPEWSTRGANADRIDLLPLSDDECLALIRALLGTYQVDGDLGRRLIRAADGNPLFLEEVLDFLMEEGLIRRDDGRWVASTDLRTIPVPPSVQALLAARLDTLTPNERSVIERASVVGEVFHTAAVAELSAPSARHEVDETIRSLVRRDLIRPGLAGGGNGTAYRFRHILIRDVAYQGTLKGTRADLHERFATWLKRTAGDRTGEYEELGGYHLEQAHRYRAELGPPDDHGRSLASRAADLLAAGGLRAADRGDARAARNLFERASLLLPGADPRRPELLIELFQVMCALGEYARADEVARDAIGAARESGNRALEWWATIDRMDLDTFTHPERTSQEDVRRKADEAIGVFEQLGDERGLFRAWFVRSFTDAVSGQFGAAQVSAERALGYARRTGRPRDEADALGLLMYVLAFGPTHVADAVRRCEEVLDGRPDDRLLRGNVLETLARLEVRLGHAERARELIDGSISISEEIGPRELAQGLWRKAEIAVLAGDLVGAERDMRRVYEMLDQTSNKGLICSLCAALAHVLCQQGRYDEAGAFADGCRSTAGPDDVDGQIGWRRARAKVLASRGHIEEAEALAREAVELAARTDWIELRADALMDLGTVLRVAERPEQAASAVEEALRLYERKGNIVSAERAWTTMGQLTGST